jgi:hypothetical protein
MIKFYGREKELSVVDSWFKASQKGTLYRRSIYSIRVSLREKNLARLEMRQTSDMIRKIADDLSNLEGRVLEMIFREKIFFIMQLDMSSS